MPEEAGSGATPHSIAKAGSLRIRAGLSRSRPASRASAPSPRRCCAINNKAGAEEEPGGQEDDQGAQGSRLVLQVPRGKGRRDGSQPGQPRNGLPVSPMTGSLRAPGRREQGLTLAEIRAVQVPGGATTPDASGSA